MVTISALIFCPVDYQVVINIKIMNRILSAFLGLAIMLTPFAVTTPAVAATNWDVSGTYTWLVLGTYSHDMTIVMNPDGSFAGTGGYPAGADPYLTSETITNGQVTGDTITFTTTYNGPYNPGYSVTLTGTIAPDGTMSGTSPWEWHTTSGVAKEVVVSSAVVCPAGTIKSALVETVVVNSNVPGGANSLALASGLTYLIEVSGTWTNRPGETVDAKYVTMDSWTTYTDAPAGGYPADLLELQIDSTITNWGAYSTTHEYSTLVTGTGAALNFRVYDGTGNVQDPSWFGDNNGSLTVNIYSCTPDTTPVLTMPTDKKECMKGGWMNLTDDNGASFKNQGDCVSFVATKGKNKAAGN